MQQVEKYQITWHAKDNAGMIHLALANNTGVSIPIDSASETTFLLELFRHEDHVYYDAEHDFISTGYDMVGNYSKETSNK